MGCLEPLPRDFYDREVCQVARELLGQLLVREVTPGMLLVGNITEVEAYLAENDPANHAFRGMTARNRSMFGPPGHAYVYPIHTRYCLNVVTEPEGRPSAVLIRAVEPTEGLWEMQRHRRTKDVHNLTTGPGKVCEAFAIDRSFDGWNLTLGRRLWIAYGSLADNSSVAMSPRVGVTAAKELPLRFFLKNSPFVSRRSGLRRPERTS
jgi:DNA-3-methyladenine glycosylase